MCRCRGHIYIYIYKLLPKIPVRCVCVVEYIRFNPDSIVKRDVSDPNKSASAVRRKINYYKSQFLCGESFVINIYVYMYTIYVKVSSLETIIHSEIFDFRPLSRIIIINLYYGASSIFLDLRVRHTTLEINV